MQKIIPYEQVLIVQHQGMLEGKRIGRDHRSLFCLRLGASAIEKYANDEALRAWQKIQLEIRELHSAWTGHKPQFLATFTAAFLLGYAEEHPKAYEVYYFPEYVSQIRSTKGRRKAAKRIARAA